MQSGQLDTLFEVLQRGPAKNSGGQVKQEWSVIGQFFGEVNPVSVNNFVQSGVQGSALVARIVMRPNDFPTLTAANLIRNVDTQQLYTITGILPFDKGRQSLMVTLGKL